MREPAILSRLQNCRMCPHSGRGIDAIFTRLIPAHEAGNQPAIVCNTRSVRMLYNNYEKIFEFDCAPQNEWRARTEREGDEGDARKDEKKRHDK